MKLKDQLHNSATHREGWDAACPVCIQQAKDIKFCVVCGNRHKPLEQGFTTCKGCTTDADRTPAAPMADERETAQWYTVNSQMKEIKDVLARSSSNVKAYGWQQLSNATKSALREELHRIQTKATAPHLFEEIPGDRPILKDKCNQCGADRDAPIHTAPACDHCNDTRKIDGEACGWCVDVAYTAPKPTGETIDLTPESLKTPEGAARVSKALDDWNNARVEFANAASRFISRHGDEIRSMLRRLNEDSAYLDCEELEELNEAFTATQDGFLRAMANHPPR